MEKPFKPGDSVQLKSQGLSAFKDAVNAYYKELPQAHLRNETNGLPWWKANQKRDECCRNADIQRNARILEIGLDDPNQPMLRLERSGIDFVTSADENNIGTSPYLELKLTFRKLSDRIRRSINRH